jgi:hypothetical protein
LYRLWAVGPIVSSQPATSNGIVASVRPAARLQLERSVVGATVGAPVSTALQHSVHCHAGQFTILVYQLSYFFNKNLEIKLNVAIIA